MSRPARDARWRCARKAPRRPAARHRSPAGNCAARSACQAALGALKPAPRRQPRFVPGRTGRRSAVFAPPSGRTGAAACAPRKWCGGGASAPAPSHLRFRAPVAWGAPRLLRPPAAASALPPPPPPLRRARALRSSSSCSRRRLLLLHRGENCILLPCPRLGREHLSTFLCALSRCCSAGSPSSASTSRRTPPPSRRTAGGTRGP